MTAANNPDSNESRDRLLLDVGGMHCAGCVANVERALGGVDGVLGAQVNLVTSQAAVDFDPRRVAPERLIDALGGAGYSARRLEDQFDLGAALRDRGQQEAGAWRARLIAGLLLLAPLAWMAHGPGVSGRWHVWLALALATPLQFVVGWPYLSGALRRLRHGSTNMDTLIALGTGAAYAAGVFHALAGASGVHHGHDPAVMYLADAGMILAFITLGRFLETKAKGRASQAIARLLDLTPPEATLVADNATRRVPPAAVMTGETILVRPGEKVPLDAEVLSGASSVDEAWLTGESIPVDKQPGDEILAGTINGSGALTARVIRPAGKTALAQVIELVRRAQESKGEIGRVADRVVAWFVPGVLLLGVLTFLGWVLLAGDPSTALSATVAVLVVACPCALGLATPTAILVGSGCGAERGILIKETRALEIAGRLTAVVLDKTGTVTLGRPDVVAVEPADAVSELELLETAASAEKLSGHPLAAPIVAAAEARRGAVVPADALEWIPGQGVRAQRQADTILVGNPQLMEQAGIDCRGFLDRLDARRRLGQTPLLVARCGRVLGLIALADPVAPTAREALAALVAMKLDVQLVSGDSRAAVEAVAAEVGISQFRAETLPEEKLQTVERLQASGQVVAMVGDGINDAPALAAADLGVAIGSGADVAIETADIVLVRPDLRSLVEAIHLSRMTLRTIRQNLAWAFGYNLVLLPLASGLLVPLFGWRLPPAAAAAAMAASSVSVVVNSLLLRGRLKTPPR